MNTRFKQEESWVEKYNNQIHKCPPKISKHTKFTIRTKEELEACRNKAYKLLVP